jgi:PAS domain S-box-containing protein
MLSDLLTFLQCGGLPHPFSANGFMPHGYCFLWRPGVLWLHVLSDAGIAAAYYCIPCVLAYFIRARRDLPFPAVFWMFSAFILLCGTTHVMSIWVLWHPNYYVEGWIKAATAVVSITATVMLFFYVPKAMVLLSAAQLADENVKLTAKVEFSEERERLTLGAIVDNVTDGIITASGDGHILSFNRACARLWGYSPEEVIGQHVAMLVPRDGQDEQLLRFQHYAEDAAAREMGRQGHEFICLRKDGTPFLLESKVSSFMLGGKTYVTGCVRDITELKAAAAEQELLLERLMESNAELERFAYVASHDMQEPVRMMLSFSELLQQDYASALDAEGQEYLAIIGSSALRIRNMIRDLLDYARFEGGGGNLGPMSMGLKWEQAADNLQQMIAETKAEVTCDELPEVQGNAMQIMRLLQNLLTNAIKFQPPGQVPRVHLAAANGAEGTVFCVRDNGIGIKPEFAEQIFAPFRRLHTWDAIPGTGLGLSICRKIVEGHGGRIWVESVVGEGTQVYFTLG